MSARDTYAVPEGTLVARTRALLQGKTQMELFRAADACGFSYVWIDALRKGLTKDPSASRTQACYEYLTKTKLEIK
jgi:hypothetical protein